ncbi:MAG: thiamine pyrophosphate-binding protein [Gammaproteobacteria bacterium]|nr:thiamine pyrophosphate-binding protein [Gammaproteobacteria bacterium]
MNIRVSEYIADRLSEWGISHVFSLTGGGAMFLNDAFGHHAKIQVVYQHHEQACAMSAEGEARLSRMPGVAIVTAGPGGINALNGVFGAWTDSIAMLVLSGQVKRETLLAANPVEHLRQLGDQEAEITKIAAPITKYSSVLLDPEQVAYELEKAWFLTNHGRPGPVWLDIPIDIQSSLVDTKLLPHFDPGEFPSENEVLAEEDLSRVCGEIAERIRNAKSPVFMAGSGIRLANAIADFSQLINVAGIPVTTAWTHDIIASDHPLYCGRPGTIGTRPGNFVVQNADLLIVIGSRLNIRQTSYNWENFAKKAFVIQVDIDSAEFSKPTYQPDQPLLADAASFCRELSIQLQKSNHHASDHENWLGWCRNRTLRYPSVLPHQRDSSRPINAYHFVSRLFELLESDDIVVTGNSTACIVAFQVAEIKAGQRLFSNSGSASMGYDLPAAIGSYYGAVADRGQQKRVICLAGDGSIMLNSQELQTIASGQIPIKIIVLNNDGYLSIRSSQTNFFNRRSGESRHSGIGFPDFSKLAEAYGIPASRIEEHEFDEDLERFLAHDGPGLLEVILDPEQGLEPRISSRQLADGTIVSPSLEDMYPFLDREELKENIFNPDGAGS